MLASGVQCDVHDVIHLEHNLWGMSCMAGLGDLFDIMVVPACKKFDVGKVDGGSLGLN